MAQYNKREFQPKDVSRLKELIREGCQVHQEIDDLKEGLNDTIKSIAEELEIMPSQLTKAIKIAHKNSLDEERDKMTEIEDILDAIGHKS